MQFSEEEQKELKARPVTVKFTAFTSDQLEIRRKIAAKLAKSIVANQEMDDELRKIYEKYPMDKFYVDNGRPKRVYGVCTAKVDGKEEERCHTGSATMMFVNLTVGGTPCSALSVVEEWTSNHLLSIMTCKSPGIFLDPLGFMLLFEYE